MGRRWDVVPVWGARGDPGPWPDGGAEIVLGFDGSYNRDCTAIVGCTVAEQPRIFLVRAWERPPDNPKWRGPRRAVIDEIRAARERGEVREFATDPPGWGREIEGMGEAFGEVVLRFE